MTTPTPGTIVIAGGAIAGVKLARGRRARQDGLPGAAAHALPLQQPGDATRIHQRVLQQLARLEMSRDTDERRRLGHFVVIGGGFAGVAVAGALVDLVGDARRRHPGICPNETAVTLLHDGQQLVPELSFRLSEAAQRSLDRRGVRVWLGARASLVGKHFVELGFGTVMATDTTVSTIGASASALVESLGPPLRHGRVVTGADCEIHGQTGPWAFGGCAAVPNTAHGTVCPPTMQVTPAQAAQLADNLVARILGRPTRPLQKPSRLAIACTGRHDAVAEILGLTLTGVAAWLVWRAHCLLRMPTALHNLRLAVAWGRSLFIPAEFTHRPIKRRGADRAAVGFGALEPLNPSHQ